MFYDIYSKALRQTPEDSWRENEQETINSLFENTTLLRTVQEEQRPFNQIYQDVEVWVDTVNDVIVNTEKDSNDFRSFCFKDIKHDTQRGTYFKYDNNYWLCYDSTTDLDPNANVKVRRCNNRLKWVDENGILQSYPCAVDYTLSSPRVKVTKRVNTPDSSITIMIQNNENTFKIKKNQRFIINKQPFYFSAYNNYMWKDDLSQEVPLLFMDLYLDTEQPNDDFENGIADNDTLLKPQEELKNGLVIEPIIESINLMETVSIKANVYKDNVLQKVKVNCVGSNLPKENYTINDLGDNTFEVTNNKFSLEPLKLTFSANDLSETIEVRLIGIF